MKTNKIGFDTNINKLIQVEVNSRLCLNTRKLHSNENVLIEQALQLD